MPCPLCLPILDSELRKVMKSSSTIRVDGKVFAKTLVFGNQGQKTVFRNRKKYNRNKAKNESYE